MIVSGIYSVSWNLHVFADVSIRVLLINRDRNDTNQFTTIGAKKSTSELENLMVDSCFV